MSNHKHSEYISSILKKILPTDVAQLTKDFGTLSLSPSLPLQHKKSVPAVCEFKNPNLDNNKFPMIDLFAGTGAFSLAFENTGMVECVFANDMYSASEEAFNGNHNVRLMNCDINHIDTKTIPTHEILCGGFPCQPFSIAGKQRGFNDQRSNVFYKILEIINEHKPAVIVLENVKNLHSHDNGNTFKIIRKMLSSAGYYIKCQILNTSHVTGVPQNRERIYIVGFRFKEHWREFNFNFDNVEIQPISDYLEDPATIDSEYYYDNRFNSWETIKKGVTKHISTNTLYQLRRHYIRENKNKVCPTLTANMGGGGHNVPLLRDNNGIRKLTPRECFNLQGFPKSYALPNQSKSMLYKLAGNAVSYPVVRLLADKITKILDMELPDDIDESCDHHKINGTDIELLPAVKKRTPKKKICDSDDEKENSKTTDSYKTQPDIIIIDNTTNNKRYH